MRYDEQNDAAWQALELHLGRWFVIRQHMRPAFRVNVTGCVPQ
jgi:hypothetical protein